MQRLQYRHITTRASIMSLNIPEVGALAPQQSARTPLHLCSSAAIFNFQEHAEFILANFHSKSMNQNLEKNVARGKIKSTLRPQYFAGCMWGIQSTILTMLN